MDNYLDNIAINTDSTTIEGEIKTIINGTRQILTRLGLKEKRLLKIYMNH